MDLLEVKIFAPNPLRSGWVSRNKEKGLFQDREEAEKTFYAKRFFHGAWRWMGPVLLKVA
ncbi:MAG: hypothetical protein A2026_20090 [Deltaproteobacteria bacterium RBG_19FT_COMBO_46_12]|nr:MAG: hypothetical protein A2026_20090 [Deltaproteobacteria bacterium RBG_19FT_COMBO_46_12]